MKKYFEQLYNKKSEKFYQEIENNLINDIKTFIVTANPETFMKAKNDNLLNQMLIDKKVIKVPDGIAIVKVANWLGYKLNERIAGIDIAVKLLEFGNKYQKTIYLFGAKDNVILELNRKLSLEYPNLKIVGSQNGYIENKEDVFKEIVKKKPDIILVALGIPTQEKLIYQHLKQFKKGIFVGVGGSFDVISGTKKRAPKLFIKLNLEWLYRILCEPKRIKRFYDSNIKFIFKAIKKENKR